MLNKFKTFRNVGVQYSDSRRIRPAETGDVSVNLPRNFFPTLSPWNYHNLNGNRNFCLTRRRRGNIHLLQQFRASLLPLQKGWYTCMWITEIMKKSLVLKASYPLYLGSWILKENLISNSSCSWFVGNLFEGGQLPQLLLKCSKGTREVTWSTYFLKNDGV